MAAAVVLTVRDLSFEYTGEAPLWSGWSADVREGATLVHGDTGSGKSTLLRLMAGTVAGRGEFTLRGTRLRDERQAYLQRLYLFEPANEAFEQVNAQACKASLSHAGAGFDEALWRELVEGFGLEPHLHKPLYMLSTGTKRKVWLAAGLACGRALVLLDEPTAGLDARSIECLWNTLARVAVRPGRAVVVASTERIDRLSWIDSIELAPR